MIASFYLVLGAKCYNSSRFDDPDVNLEMAGTPRCVKSKPAIDSREVALKFNIDIPDSLFRKPLLTINTTISEAARGDEEIVARLQQEISDRLQDVKGVSVTIEAPTIGQ